MKPKQIIFFTTTKGKLWLDLNEVAGVFSVSDELRRDRIGVQLKCNALIQLDLTFKDDLDRAMEAWANFRNAHVAEEVADLVEASAESETPYTP